MLDKNSTIAIVGLGYVGLPLALEFGRKFTTIGFDIDGEKIAAYRRGEDPSQEISSEEFHSSKKLQFTEDPGFLTRADVVVVAVPTPVDAAHIPDLTPLISASTLVGKNLKYGAIVVYESTVYPGVTEEVCVPIIERESGFEWKKEFNVGYSPERVNPGDKDRTITKIVKIVSADNSKTLDIIATLYESVIDAGVYRASSIAVAEAAKVIENTQRDLNIALMNELAIIFKRFSIDTREVLEAAGTKWNFLKFQPGLVGGHCIGVDPYYLTHKAETAGYHPEVILAGRRINDSMPNFVAQQTIKEMISANISVKGSKVLVLGVTFKENCVDIRNSKVIDLIRELQEFGCNVLVHDPIASSKEVCLEHGLNLLDWDHLPRVETLILAVPHKFYLDMPLSRLLSNLDKTGVFVDIKSVYPKEEIAQLGPRSWRL